ncbi:MAG: outer membrane lipoprotein carrier protein LolA [Bacteroidales bacterium]|jgi:outer membrane lipoprotein-sorting protein|nr:outer membrane lipoprotein carrier protein LolA [Bacteroidales bacterium]
MKKIFLIAFVFTSTIFNASAQTDTKAKAILDALSAKLDALETMKFEFSYTMTNTAENINETKTGSIYIKDDKYRLYIADQLIICDGTTIWTILKEDKEVQINSVDPTNQNTPNKMLTSYNKNYKAKFIKEAPKAGIIMQTLDLTPLTAQSFYKVRLEINKLKNMVYSSTIYDKNGTTYTYLVTSFIENPKVFESRFTFNKADYPDYSINDMR